MNKPMTPRKMAEHVSNRVLHAFYEERIAVIESTLVDAMAQEKERCAKIAEEHLTHTIGTCAAHIAHEIRTME